MKLPTRPSTYIMTVLLLILIALAYYISVAVTSPELQHAIERAKEHKAAGREAK